MGTNHYVTKLGEYSLHVGKKSAGWKFSFHSIPERGLTTKQAWIDFLRENDGYIVLDNDNGAQVRTVEQLIEVFAVEGMNMEEYLAEYPPHNSNLTTILSERTHVDEGHDFDPGVFC